MRDYKESVNTAQTHRGTDRRRTKWYLCAAMIRRRHKKAGGGGGYAELKNKIGTNCDVNTKLGNDTGGLRDCKTDVLANFIILGYIHIRKKYRGYQKGIRHRVMVCSSKISEKNLQFISIFSKMFFFSYQLNHPVYFISWKASSNSDILLYFWNNFTINLDAKKKSTSFTYCNNVLNKLAISLLGTAVV